MNSSRMFLDKSKDRMKIWYIWRFMEKTQLKFGLIVCQVKKENDFEFSVYNISMVVLIEHIIFRVEQLFHYISTK